MNKSRFPHGFLGFLCLTWMCFLGCTSSSRSTGTHTLPPSTGLVTLCLGGERMETLLENWSAITVGVKTITLQPKNGGTPVTLFASSDENGIPINLLNLNNMDQLIGRFAVPIGTYTSATLAFATPGIHVNVMLATNGYTTPGFPGTGTDWPWVAESAQFVGHSEGGVTTLATNLRQPLEVTTNGMGFLDLVLDLSSPAILIDSDPNPKTGEVPWIINLNQIALNQRIVTDPSRILLRPVECSNTVIASDHQSIAISLDFKDVMFASTIAPPTTLPQSIQVRLDPAGTTFFDTGKKTSQVLTDFSPLTDYLQPKDDAFMVGSAELLLFPRLQDDGSLVATRVWALKSYTYDNDRLNRWSEVRSGRIVSRTLDDATQIWGIELMGNLFGGFGYGYICITEDTEFFIRNPSAESIPIGKGVSRFTSLNLQRGTKLAVACADNMKDALVVEIMDPHFTGTLSNLSEAGFTTVHNQGLADADYTTNLAYVPDTFQNGKNRDGTPIEGFAWWMNAAPFSTSAENSVAFANFVPGSVDFGGTVGALGCWSSTQATWDTNAQTLLARWTVIEPITLPKATIASALSPSADTTLGSFGITLPGGANTVTVDTKLVAPGINIYTFNRTTRTMTGPVTDATWQSKVTEGSQVLVQGIPRTNGHINATALIFVQ